jgi:Fur family transcriptional regulator, ferric uptake regulator
MNVIKNKNISHTESKEYLISFLKQHHLSVTKPRIKILKLFQNCGSALENSLIEKKTRHQLNRITVYRTLQSFLKNGIIHSIPSYDDSIRYALCKGDCDEHAHYDNHPHFVCQKCGKVICLNKIDISIIQPLKGYTVHKVDAIISGVCNICKSAKLIRRIIK